MADKKSSWFKRHKVLTVIGALILIAIVVSAGGGNSKKDASSNSGSDTKTSTSQKAATPAAAKLGTAVRDGKFEFTVNGVTCNNPSVHDSTGYLTKTAQGQYCILDMSVKNIGNEAQTLDASNQFLYNAAGQKYSSDSEASYDANPSGSTFLESINPRNSASGKFVFDIPKDQTAVTAELHDSAFSGGVKVTLQ